MSAATITSFGAPLEIKEMDIPTPGRGEVLVKLHATGVCHSDLHLAQGDWALLPSLPRVPGHEGIGEVVETGQDVETLAVGDMVGNAWLWRACGTCENCRTGWETICANQVTSGVHIDGSFGQYMLVDERFAGRFHPDVDAVEAAPILCAGVTVYKGLKVSEARPGQWVTIAGIGGLGHLAVQYAKAMGLRVAAVDVAEDKLQLAKTLGAELTVNAKEHDPAEEITRQTGGGTNAVIVTASHPAAHRQAVGMARDRGTVVLIGMPDGNFEAPIRQIVAKALTIRGSAVGTRQDLVEAIEFYNNGKVKPIVTGRTLDEVNTVFGEMQAGKIDGRVSVDYLK